MGIKNNKNFVLFISVAVITFTGYVWLLKQPFFQGFIEWAQQNFILYISILVLAKVLSIVWPPLPGTLLTLGSIPVIGWLHAYLADMVGGLAGASLAYYLGRKYGRSFLKKIFDEKTIAKIYRIKIVKNKELEAIFFIRLFTGLVSEAISYGSGLLGIKYRNFFLATVLVYLLFVPLFYLAGDIFRGKNIVPYAIVILGIGTLFYKLRGRYFE